MSATNFIPTPVKVLFVVAIPAQLNNHIVATSTTVALTAAPVGTFIGLALKMKFRDKNTREMCLGTAYYEY